MRKLNLNWGVMLAAVVLLMYTYVSFLGLLYLVDGVVWKAALAALGVIVVVSLCVYVMCLARATKWKNLGTVGQSVFGVIILASFLASGIPFTSFLKVMGNREEIEKSITEVKASAEGLNMEYNLYVEMRMVAFEEWLKENAQVYKNAGGKDDQAKIANVAGCLERRLHPDSLDVRQQERHKWIDEISGMSIYNILLPQNLLYMENCVGEWYAEYVAMSKVTIGGAPYDEFRYDNFSKKLKEVMESMKEVGLSFWAILVALFTFFMMLLPYWLTIPTPNDPDANDGEIVFK